ncbi:Maf family protein [Aureimonas altamirensis]|uniref:Maf family protein n=1 Tax=Aureimonas altamirensis TaxID=370622 RepID=UPI0020371639|nr:Maf family protein [Aureimonas altamirensis]MCM2505747.1 Maf family protein [Aureimonas altamirensis]
MAKPIILASGSMHRRRLLEGAGIAVEAVASSIDERAVEESLGDAEVTADDLASILAEAKATDVSQGFPGRVVVGADQTLELDGVLFHKPTSMEEARRTLLALSGHTHRLHSAYALVRDGTVLRQRVETASITLRPLTPANIGHYLAKAGEAVLGSVGAYHIEGPGIRLMDRIDGDYFTIVGLPLLALIKDLEAEGALDA